MGRRGGEEERRRGGRERRRCVKNFKWISLILLARANANMSLGYPYPYYLFPIINSEANPGASLFRTDVRTMIFFTPHGRPALGELRAARDQREKERKRSSKQYSNSNSSILSFRFCGLSAGWLACLGAKIETRKRRPKKTRRGVCVCVCVDFRLSKYRIDGNLSSLSALGTKEVPIHTQPTAHYTPTHPHTHL